MSASGGARWLALGVALLLVNVSVTFTNIWPTLGIWPNPDLSVEAAVAVLSLVLFRGWADGPVRRVTRWLSAAWLVLMVGRYADVTASSLYGRDINLYWDLQHIPSVGAMFAFVADPWLKVGIAGAVVLVPAVLYLTLRWAFSTIAIAAGHPRARGGLGWVAVAVLALGVLRWQGVETPTFVQLAEPVTPAYARELKELVYEASGAGMRDLGPPPVMRSDLSRVDSADVFIFFLESYGAVSWERETFVDALEPVRTRLGAAIDETGRRVASAYVESTTFGGESWLAHISLLSGTEVRDQGTNVRLMAQERDTMVKVFARSGYRTVAIMPGLLVGWPEGAFYGFQEIYNHDRLDYRGPSFGWWDINDQFALARVDAAEIAPTDRSPAFVFFATITTHAPFVPTPPYQPDWARVLSATPYDPEALDRAWSAWPDWTDLGPSYLEALEYAFTHLTGYLRLRADRDLVMVLVGDHQPPALVSGEGASWDVPVHVISNRTAVVDRLIAQHAFNDGLTPTVPSVESMDGLLGILLDAFGNVTPVSE